MTGATSKLYVRSRPFCGLKRGISRNPRSAISGNGEPARLPVKNRNTLRWNAAAREASRYFTGMTIG
jgi:hypothetical protein